MPSDRTKAAGREQVGNFGQPDVRLTTGWPELVEPSECILYCPWLDGADPVRQLWVAVLGWHDVNGRLLAALKQLPVSGAKHPNVFAGMFCADPFCDLRSLFAALMRSGVSGVVNLPAVTFLDGEVAGTLASLNLGAERELACLRQARAAGLRVIGCAADSRTAVALQELGAELLIVHGGPPTPGWQKREAGLRQAADTMTGVPVIGLGRLLANAVPRADTSRGAPPLTCGPAAPQSRRGRSS